MLHHIESGTPTTVDLLHGTRATVVAVLRADEPDTVERVRVTVTDIRSRTFGPFDLYVDATNDAVSAISLAFRAHGPLTAIGLTHDETGRLVTAALRSAGLACPSCDELFDRDCFGESRCANCDSPCPGCYDGPGPDGP